jgi:translation initiation factor 3 subunit L
MTSHVCLQRVVSHTRLIIVCILSSIYYPQTGQLRKQPNSDQLFKNYDRMIALLAVVTHLCPAQPVEESLAKAIREKHGGQLSKEAYGDLFVFCSPKFISPAIPDYTTKDFPMENAYKHQVHLLEQELSCQSTFRQLRTYLKLYTSLDVSKLVSFGNDQVTLASMKLVQRQLEISEGNNTNGEGGDDVLKSAMDIHYYIQEDTILIDEAEKQRRFENYFLGAVEQSFDIRKDVNAISTDV